MTLCIDMDNNLTEREAAGYSPLSLAFLGDSVYDTLMREYLLKKANMQAGKLHAEKVRLVCAEFQAKVYDHILDRLSEREVAVLKRGRNAAGTHVPKHAEPAQYRKATAVESLFGYLCLLGDEVRMREIFDMVKEIILEQEI